MKITDITRNEYDTYRAIVDKIRKASERAFIEAGCPIPWWFEDTNMSVMFDAVEEIIARGQEVEDRAA